MRSSDFIRVLITPVLVLALFGLAHVAGGARPLLLLLAMVVGAAGVGASAVWLVQAGKTRSAELVAVRVVGIILALVSLGAVLMKSGAPQ